MPLYSDTSLYSLPSYALYLSSPYAGHSSLISSYSRPAFSKPLSRYHRNFAPHLATISENQVTALRRKYSPRLRLSASTFTVPRPIKINTADIDISANKYRLQNVKATPEKEEVIKGEEGKPIRRDRATVRLHTVHKDKKDKRWRQNFNSFELNIDNSKNKKEEDEKETEEVQLPKSPSFHDICKAISTDSINEELNPGQPAHVIRKQSRTYSNEDLSNRIRRNSAEILKGNIEALDQPTNEDINNNELKRPTKTEDSFESRVSVRKKKKVAKKKSQTELNSSQPEETEAPPTPPSLQRRNAKNSSFKDISKVEVEEMRKKPKPLFTATVDVEEPKPNLKLIIDDVKVEESPKLKPKKFKLNVTVQVDEKPKLKKKIDDKGKMYIPNSKPALVTNIKKKEQRGSLGDIWEGIEEMPKRKSLGGNQEDDRDEPNQEKEETTDRNQQTDNNEKEVTEQHSLEMKNNNLGITKNNVEVNNRNATENNNKEIEVIDKINKDIEVRSVQLQADKTELNTNKIGLNEDEIKLVDKNNQISDNKSGINTKNLGINKIEDEIGRNEEATSNKSAVASLENNISGLKRKDENLRSKSPEKEEKVGFPRVRTRKEEDVSSINDQKLAEEKKQILKPNKNQEDLLTPDENANQSKEDVNVGLKWTQKLNCDSAKEKKALKLKLNDVNPKIEEETGKDTTPIINTNQNQKRDSDALKDNNKRGFDGKSAKIEEKKENKMIPKWKQDLKKAQQDKIPKNEGIKSIMKDSKVDGVRDYKKCVSIEEKQTRAEEENEDNENMDFWDIIGAKSSVYEKKPIELKSVPFNSFSEGQEETTQEPEEEIQNQEETEQQQSTDDLLESEESKDEVPRLKPVSKRSLVNKATDEDPDLQVFVPPPKPPTPEPQPQEFVPLQSNRLTQWMHPFKKPEQFDECPIEIYARPKIIRKRHFPKPRHVVAKESDSEETSSEGESSPEEGNVGKSTSSNDSGFNSSNGCGQNLNDKDCDVNIHRKCEKLTANLCGINQKLIVEAIESVKKGSSDARDSPTSNPAHNPAFALDACDAVDAEFQMSSTYASFQKSGRITPPATTIPRFRKYTIDDFNFLKVLGKGSFGKVLLAELKDTEYYYAIKCLKKDVVLEDDDVECTLIERKVLALGTKHPYLCHLLCTFQTESHLFFVMEYLNGGDLMFHIQQSGRFPEPRARFYGAEIVSGLKFLHNKGIVYRDLKLDNVLLDFDGHVRIADFGMCKLQIFLDRMADTFCGTPDYMAPEIIKGQHYNQCVDWWSFGILLYEMLIGQSPFSGCDEDELFWSICNEKPVFPRFLSAEANSVLTQLLEKDWNKRLGNKLSPHGDIQDNPFFRPIAWDLLEMRHLEAPFKPNLQHPLDTQYFDKTFTVEKAKLTPIEKNILQSMDQTQFQGFSYTNPNATDR